MKKYPPKYDRYIEHVMRNAPPKGPEREQFLRDLDRSIADFEHEDACINAGKCPGCGGPLHTQIDPRQVGPVELELHAGKWINYRCASDPPIGVAGPRTCSWRGVDRKEPIGEN